MVLMLSHSQACHLGGVTSPGGTPPSVLLQLAALPVQAGLKGRLSALPVQRYLKGLLVSLPVQRVKGIAGSSSCSES